MKTNLSECSLVIAIGRWKSDISKFVTFANAVLTVSNTYFLGSVYMRGRTSFVPGSKSSRDEKHIVYMSSFIPECRHENDIISSRPGLVSSRPG